MPKISLNYEDANSFVEKNKSLGFFWDGWTMVKWSPSNNGYLNANGMYRNGKWGYSTRINMTNLGTWEISDKYVKLV